VVINHPMLLFSGIFISGVTADRYRLEAVEYKVGDLVLLSTKDLKW